MVAVSGNSRGRARTASARAAENMDSSSESGGIEHMTFSMRVAPMGMEMVSGAWSDVRSWSGWISYRMSEKESETKIKSIVVGLSPAYEKWVWPGVRGVPRVKPRLSATSMSMSPRSGVPEKLDSQWAERQLKSPAIKTQCGISIAAKKRWSMAEPLSSE